jgi:hypothetical protein
LCYCAEATAVGMMHLASEKHSMTGKKKNFWRHCGLNSGSYAGCANEEFLLLFFLNQMI